MPTGLTRSLPRRSPRSSSLRRPKSGDILCWYSFGVLDAIRHYHGEWSRSFKGAQTHLGGLLSRAPSLPAIHHNILEWSRLARDLRKEAVQWGVTCGVRHVLHDIAVPSN